MIVGSKERIILKLLRYTQANGKAINLDYFFCEFERDSFGLYDQVNKRIRWMPWQSEAMKDVIACEKRRGAGK